MSLGRSQIIFFVTSWCLAAAVLFGVRLALGLPPSLAGGIAIVLLGCVPAVVLMKVFRGAPPQSIAQVLYDAERVAGPAAGIAPGPADRGDGTPVA